MYDDIIPDLCMFGGPMDDLDEKDLSEAIADSIHINPRNGTLGLPIAGSGMDQRKPRLAMMVGKFWKPGSELRIAFMSGTPWQHDQVKKFAPIWTQYANLKFKFVDYDKSSPPDILINFDPSRGSNSYLGTDSAGVARRGRHSMNLGWINEKTGENARRSTILHEFGHALGAVHEHSSPRAEINWNKEAVYARYSGPPSKWDKAKIDHNVLRKIPDKYTKATEFDPDSIMLYGFPGSLTMDGKGTERKYFLSARDKEFMRFIYPFDTHDVGMFNTIEVATGNKSQQVFVTTVPWNRKYSSPPAMVWGFNHLDIPSNRNLRIQANITDKGPDHFKARIGTWMNSEIHSAGMTWIEVGPDCGFVHTGSVSLRDIPGWQKKPSQNSKRVTFLTPFKNQPKVVCFLTLLDFFQGEDWHVKTYATNIDHTGFTIHMDTRSSGVMHGVCVSWFAYEAGRPDMISGRFSTNDIRVPSQHRHDATSAVIFDKTFSRTPKVLLALDELDYAQAKDLRLRVSTSMVSKDGFTWHLQSWDDSIMYSAGASYLAWAETEKSKSNLNGRGIVIV
ncbi:hypothetical protein AFLA70_332g001031 [Aspergillus flavus AF70]|nr:hypothetical protein AFLA70_332g001031 [Aspergillus flavus AF70]